jgi:quinol monooxygenase YgiN
LVDVSETKSDPARQELDMNKNIVRLNVGLAIQAGKLDEFQKIAQDMTAVSENEPGTLGYDWYFSGDRILCRLVESYVDGDALLAHFKGPAVQQLVPKMLENSSISSFEVYGDPGAEPTKMLAGFGAKIFLPWNRISR